MNITRKEHAELVASRMADLEAAAKGGGTWAYLGKRWGLESHSAAEWAKQRDAELSDQVSANSGRVRQRRQFTHGTDMQPFVAQRAHHASCQRWIYRDRQAVQCGAPTEGKTYCKTCARHLLTLTDRPPIAEPTDRKPYRWEREIWKRKSA